MSASPSVSMASITSCGRVRRVLWLLVAFPTPADDLDSVSNNNVFQWTEDVTNSAGRVGAWSNESFAIAVPSICYVKVQGRTSSLGHDERR